jgi:hypothetical protein
VKYSIDRKHASSKFEIPQIYPSYIARNYTYSPTFDVGTEKVKEFVLRT